MCVYKFLSEYEYLISVYIYYFFFSERINFDLFFLVNIVIIFVYLGNFKYFKINYIV